MGEIKYSNAPYAIWSEDMLLAKLDNIVSSAKGPILIVEADFFYACVFKLCKYRGKAIKHRGVTLWPGKEE